MPLREMLHSQPLAELARAGTAPRPREGTSLANTRRCGGCLTTGARRGFPGDPRRFVAETTLPSAPGHLRLSPAWLLFAALALAIPVAPLLLHRRPPALPAPGAVRAVRPTRHDGR